MKINLSKIKSFVLFTFCISLIIIQSCKTDVDNTDVTQKADHAELLQRGEKIQLGKEWDHVQNAYSDFTKEIDANPHDNKSRIGLAQLYIREARVTGEHGHYYPAALDVLQDALDDSELTDDDKFLALMTKAGVQLSLHEFESALKTGNKAALLNPLNAQIHGVLVDANVELGNYDKAVMLSDKMMSIKPDIRSYSRVSYLREIHGDVDGAIEAMSFAIKSGYPGTEETAWAMLTLGDMYREYGKEEEAEKVYKNILDLREDYPFAVGALGDLYMDQGKEELAEKTLKEAMDIIPEVGFYISLADLYKQQGKDDKVKELLDEIFVMLKDDTDSGHNMNLEYAHLYMDILEDNDKAMEYAKLEYDKRPNNIDINRTMAAIYHKMENDAEAKKYLEVAGKTNSKKPEYLELKKAVK